MEITDPAFTTSAASSSDIAIDSARSRPGDYHTVAAAEKNKMAELHQRFLKTVVAKIVTGFLRHKPSDAAIKGVQKRTAQTMQQAGAMSRVALKKMRQPQQKTAKAEERPRRYNRADMMKIARQFSKTIKELLGEGLFRKAVVLSAEDDRVTLEFGRVFIELSDDYEKTDAWKQHENQAWALMHLLAESYKGVGFGITYEGNAERAIKNDVKYRNHTTSHTMTITDME
jgi:hypothetical protein